MPHFVHGNCDPWVLLQCLSSSVHQGISVIDKDLNLVLLNRTARELLDLPEDLLVDDPSLASVLRYNAHRGDYGPGDPDKQVAERIELAKQFVAHDFVRERPDGTLLRVQGTPMDNGGFVTIYTDVTQEKRQEEELKSARQKLEGTLSRRDLELKSSRDLMLNAINAISDGLAVTNKDGHAVLVNDRMREIYPQIDKTIEEGGTIVDIIRTVFPDEPERSLDEFTEDPEMWVEREFPDGKWYKITRARTSDAGLISVYSDVTSYKQQHAVLRDHTDELVRLLGQEKKLTEMQREFVSMASHEFRTPLAIIDSNAQRLKRRIDKLEPEMVLDRAGRIRESVERMQYLINRFLNFSQSQSEVGGMELQIAPTQLRELVETVCSGHQSVAKSFTIHTDISGLPETSEIDRGLVEQCLSNIVSNAIKYSPERRDIYLEGKEDEGFAVISVRDEGVGIPEDEIPKVFNRYFRASTSSGIAGTGIGLNMTEMIVKKHFGKVEVESRVGEGTTVTLKLPIKAKQKRGSGKGEVSGDLAGAA
ncbi:PAS-domain containing protein [Labrenzia sp. CE80]|uniref:sensor histidine kinase n=1 Tax=Labrenzia sp. CE80 TaxID=1788986 RepID=UPI00129A379F|nr:PAS-domain containing protein [Labrenzia sp. CE80]